MGKLEYGVSVRARPNMRQTREAAYEHAVADLSTISPPWGLKGVVIKPLPPFKKAPGVSYTRELGGPIQSFGIGFVLRHHSGDPPDDPLYDDSLSADIRIDNKSMDYAYFVKTAFPLYVQAIGAYHADFRAFLPSWLKGPEWENGVDVDNCRQGVQRIWPANFWDRELCKRAFSLTPEQVVGCLQEHVAEARVFLDGALIIYSYERVPDARIPLIDNELRPLLVRHVSS